MPQLSIVIPNYNHAGYLPAAVTGYLGLTDPADEVIVVDDASTDSSVDVLRALAAADARVRVVQHRANRGPAAALNTGLAAARGGWIYFRGADDLCPVGSLTTFRTLVDRFPDAGMIAGDPVHFETDPNRGVRERLGRTRTPMEVSHETFLERFGSNIIHGPFCRTDWVRADGGFDESLRWHCDWFLYMALGLMRGFVYAPHVFSAIRMNPRSYNAAGTATHSAQRSVLERLAAEIGAEFGAARAHPRQRMSRLLWSAASSGVACRAGGQDAALCPPLCPAGGFRARGSKRNGPRLRLPGVSAGASRADPGARRKRLGFRRRGSHAPIAQGLVGARSPTPCCHSRYVDSPRARCDRRYPGGVASGCDGVRAAPRHHLIQIV